MGSSRVTARVLPVNEHDEVLLLQDFDPAHPDVLRWGTIGGALDPGEDHLTAAVREMFEETGVRIDVGDLTAPFHRSRTTFSWDGVDHDSDNTFYAVSLDGATPVSFAHLVPEEVETVVGWGWWTSAALAAEGGAVPEDLPHLIDLAVEAVRRP